MKRVLSIILAALFIFAAMPFTASAAEEVVINLADYGVTNGDDIGTVFDNATKQADDDKTDTVYRIVIPAGTYYGNNMHIYSDMIIDMTSGATIKNNGTATMFRYSTISYFTNDGKGINGYDAGGNVTFIGGTIDGDAQESAILKFGHLSGVTIKNVTMKNVKKKHYIEFSASENVTIENCKFLDYAGSWGGNGNVEAIQIDACINEHFTGFSPDFKKEAYKDYIQDETICRNISITNCTFKNLKRGVGSHSGVATSFFENITITNNTFENIEGYAINATNYKNCTISGNVIKNAGSGIMFRTMDGAHSNFYEPRAKSYKKQTKYVDMKSTITNNEIQVTPGYKKTFVNTAYGIQLYGEEISASLSKSTRSKKGNKYLIPEGDFRVSGVTVENNTITLTCEGYGIWLQGAAENTVAENDIECNIAKEATGGTGDGIRMQDYSIKNVIKSNTIENTTAKGSLDSGMFGINIIDYSSSNTISKNTIIKPKKDGISIKSSSSNKLTSNTISNVKRDGIHLVSSKKTKVTSNTIKKPTRDGILAEKSASLTIQSNKMSKCRTAINLKSSKSAKLVSNKSTSCSSDAIKLESSPSATINKNSLNTQKRDGINIVKSKKIVITSNTITKSTRYGINSTKAQIKKDSKNKITKSGKRARSWVYK